MVILRLSNRERLILKLAAAGYTATEIGHALKLSPKTVETYRSRLMRKLDLHSRHELVSYALTNGILSADNLSESNFSSQQQQN